VRSSRALVDDFKSITATTTRRSTRIPVVESALGTKHRWCNLAGRSPGAPAADTGVSGPEASKPRARSPGCGPHGGRAAPAAAAAVAAATAAAAAADAAAVAMGKRGKRHSRPLSRAAVESLVTRLTSQLQLAEELAREQHGLRMRLAALSLLRR
jgi:hypothetical protein